MTEKEGFAMYETLKRLYKGGQLRAEQLASAVAKGWLTEAQAKEIKGKD